MQRIIAHLETAQIARLAHHSERTGAPRAELIRRGIDEILRRLDEEEYQTRQREYTTTPPQTKR